MASTMSISYWEGYEAFYKNKEKEDKFNPYTVESREHQDFETGYQDARFDECEEEVFEDV